MKKMTSRILALVVALCVMLMPAALAEQNAFSLTVGNIELTMDGETISLPVYLTLGAGADVAGERGLVWIDLATSEESAATGYAALENGEIKLYLNGMNYGFTATLEELVALLESEMGMTMDEMMAEIMSSLETELPEGFESSVSGLMDSAANLEAAGEIDPAALMQALNMTVTEIEAAEVEILGETVTASGASFTMAEQTFASMINALGELEPAFADYWAEYSATMDAAMAAEGEDISMNELMEMVSLALEGTVYANDAYALFDVDAALSAEGETIVLPLTIATATTETGSVTQVTMNMELEGDVMNMEIYLDENEDAAGSDGSFVFFMEVADAESGESEGGLSFSGSYVNNAEEVGLALGFEYADTYDVVGASFAYTGAPAAVTENGTSYDGLLSVSFSDGYSDVQINLDTNLTLTSLPEGELLTLADSIKLLEMTDEQMTQIETDLQTVVIQALGVLMQDPALAPMISGMMGM